MNSINTYISSKFIDSDEEVNWTFSIHIEVYGIIMTFDVLEPYLHTYSDWQKLFNSRHTIQCYMGNGEGSLTNDGSNIVLIAAPSGSGGDVSAKITIPHSVILEKLKKAFEEFKEKNYMFE